MGRYEYGRRYRSRRRRRNFSRIGMIAAGLVLVVGIGAGVVFATKHTGFGGKENTGSTQIVEENTDIQGESASADTTVATEKTTAASPAAALLASAEALAVGYDYDGAIELLSFDAQYASEPEVLEAIAGYESVKETLVKQDLHKITHVFFHSLVVDTAKAFDGDDDEKGYNQVMTTVSEFEKILQVMYDKGYVLVSLHDMASEETLADGTLNMKPGTILLPEGKTAFVMSQDDLCYYPYMTGDGFATRMVIGEDGYPTCEMKMEDGSVQTGDFDLVPILEKFIQEHPDFSYKGARAVLAFTGYEGILGYRTADSYADSETYQADREAAAKVAQSLRDHGWELASHSWGHLNLGTVEMERFKTDTDKWEKQVESLIGPTDIILYPFGADISDWHPYDNTNERYNYLYAKGFRYFCNVDSNEYWVQIGDKFMRQGRRNLDGYRMWKDISAEDESGKKLTDLFDSKDIFDSARPTPVPEM